MWFIDLAAVEDTTAVAETIAEAIAPTIGIPGAPVGGPVTLLRGTTCVIGGCHWSWTTANTY